MTAAGAGWETRPTANPLAWFQCHCESTIVFLSLRGHPKEAAAISPSPFLIYDHEEIAEPALSEERSRPPRRTPRKDININSHFANRGEAIVVVVGSG